MASDIWLRTILIVRKETRCRHIDYSFQLTARVLLYAYTMAFVTPVMEHWLEQEIAQWVHPMKDRSDDPSHHEQTLLSRSYISLLPRAGRHRVPMPHKGRHIHTLHLQNCFLTSSATNLLGHRVSCQTVARRFRAHGIRASRPLRGQLLTVVWDWDGSRL